MDGGIWIVDILDLAENFEFISFNYIRREINQLAAMLEEKLIC